MHRLRNGYCNNHRKTRVTFIHFSPTVADSTVMPVKSLEEKRRGIGRIRLPLVSLKVQYPNGSHILQTGAAHLVDTGAGGLGIACTFELQPYCQVMVWGNLGMSLIRQSASVRWCRPTKGGKFRIGLLLIGEPVEVSAPEFAMLDVRKKEQTAAQDPKSLTNFFEVLGVEPKDGEDAILRSYRILCQRFGPDNYRTGNAELLRKTQEAFEVLSNTKTRKVYMTTMGITRVTLDEHQ